MTRWPRAVSRVPYLGMAFLGLLSIYIGLWPSILTVGALVGVIVVPLAVAGAVAPTWFSANRFLPPALNIGAGFLAVQCLLVVVWVAYSWHRTAIVSVPPGVGVVRVVYGVVDGEPRDWDWFNRYYRIPADGVLQTRFSRDRGFYREGEPHPAVFVVRHEDGREEVVTGAWQASGTREGSGCRLEFDEFVIGAKRPAPVGTSHWMDSLPSWGVTCREEKVVRGVPTAVELEAMQTAGKECWETPDGGISCWGGHRTD